MTTQPNEHEPVTESVSAPDRVRDAVIEAARRLFAERGIHAVSVREIAREVGVSHTLLHLYFGNKEEIVRQVLKRYDHNVAAEFLDAEKIDVAVGQIFREVVSDPALVKVLGAALVEGIVPDRIAAPGVTQKALIEQLDGKMSDGVDPRIVSVLLSSMAIGWAISSDWLLDEVGIPPEDRELAVEKAASMLQKMVRECL